MLSSLRQGLAQLMDQVAEIGARLRLGRVGPEEKGKLLARLRRVAMEHQYANSD